MLLVKTHIISPILPPSLTLSFSTARFLLRIPISAHLFDSVFQMRISSAARLGAESVNGSGSLGVPRLRY